MRVLVVGSGAREHAIVEALSRSPHKPSVYCAPGNPGIAEFAQCMPIAADDVERLTAFARSSGITLAIVGPEGPLKQGLTDSLQSKGIAVLGPTQAAAQLETSKLFGKQVLRKAGVATARWRSFSDPDLAAAFVRSCPEPVVIKADGLAGGKGVVVASSADEGAEAIDQLMRQRRYGEAGDQVIVEQRLTGEEVSLMAFVSDEVVRMMPPVRDHKRLGDGDLGPNTGGMGAYTPVAGVDAAFVQYAQQAIFMPVVKTLSDMGIRYRGVLYVGLMLTDAGPRVLEFNCRFGDPEAQVVLPMLTSDLLDVALAVADGSLHEHPVRFNGDASVCVVLANAGYPEAVRTQPRPVEGIEAAREHASVLHGATRRQRDGSIVATGGRVLSVVGGGESLSVARRRAYDGLLELTLEGGTWRSDIAGTSLPRFVRDAGRRVSPAAAV